MSDLAKMLRNEQRRHFAMSFGLIAAAVVSATMVTNERGVFSSVFDGPLSALERAFTAITDDNRTPILFHKVVPNAFGDEPFDVLGAPGDLRRRLMDALGGQGDPTAIADSQLPPILAQQITPDQLAVNDVPGSLPVDSQTPVTGPSGNPGLPGAPGPAQTIDTQAVTTPEALVPEPAVWALLVGGFGLVGLLQRRSTATRRRRAFLAGE